MFKKILLAVDLSDNSEYVSQKTAELAAPLGASVRLIHVRVLQAGDLEYDPGSSEEQERLSREPGGELFELEKCSKILKSHGVSTDYITCSGTPSEEILKAAKEYPADMIVLGSHGHGKLYHLLAGSTRESMLSHTYYPVLVIRRPST